MSAETDENWVKGENDEFPGGTPSMLQEPCISFLLFLTPFFSLNFKNNANIQNKEIVLIRR